MSESKKGTHTVYLIHFDRPYRHARHYIGITAGDVNERIRRHEANNGARLMEVVSRAGIPWRVARVWENVPRFYEMKLKRQGGASRLCPICRAERTAS